MERHILILPFILFTISAFSQQSDLFPQQNMQLSSILPGILNTYSMTRMHKQYFSLSHKQQWQNNFKNNPTSTFVNYEQLLGDNKQDSRIALGSHILIRQTDPIRLNAIYPKIAFRRKLGKRLRDGSLSIGLQTGIVNQVIMQTLFNPFHPGDKLLKNSRRNRFMANLGMGIFANRTIKFNLLNPEKTNEGNDIIYGGYAMSNMFRTDLNKENSFEADLKQVPHNYFYLGYIATKRDNNFLQLNLSLNKTQNGPTHKDFSGRYYASIIGDHISAWIGAGYAWSRFHTIRYEIGISLDNQGYLMFGLGREHILMDVGENLTSFDLSLIKSWSRKTNK